MIAPPQPQQFLDWSVAARPLPGEAESGDRAVVRVIEDAALVAAVDGLGHGTGAARAAEAAVKILAHFAHERLETLAERCHRGLRGTRGVALCAAQYRGSENTMTWLGIGSIAARLVRAASPGGAEVLVSSNGIAGDRTGAMRVSTLSVRRGDVLVLATDGIDAAFADTLDASGSTRAIADSILRAHAKPTDDALVAVARYLGRHE